MRDAGIARRSVRSWRLWVLRIAFIVLLAAVAGRGAWWWLNTSLDGDPADWEPADWEAVYSQNNRAIAIMEGFNYVEAIPEFEKVVQMAPNWWVGDINVGIALLHAGGDDPSQLPRCRDVFEYALRCDPDNLYAHFCMGLLLMYRKGRDAEAMRHFEAVLKKDPNDAYSWYWLGTLKSPGSDEQTECYRQALKRNRHLGSAIFGLARNLRDKDPKVAETLLEEFASLQASDWCEIASSSRYGEMGSYARVIGAGSDSSGKPRIGPLPRFQARTLSVHLAADTRWATAAGFGSDALAQVRRLVRARFGATLVVLDYNRDDRPDLFLAGAVVEKGQMRDLLLRNDGSGHLTDVTAEAGLAQPRPTLGCVVADFDNDRWPDLHLTGAGVQKLFRNTGTGKFEDVTAKAGLDKLTSVCLGASLLDLNHDGNLDMVICEYAANAPLALEALQGQKRHGGLAVYLNSGTAPQVQEDEKRPALTCAFRRTENVSGIKEETCGLTNLAVSDLDSDGDLDLVIFADDGRPTLLRNDRLLRFHRQSLFPDGVWNGALVLDANHDGRSDMLLLERQGLSLLRNRAAFTDEDGSQLFANQVATDWPPLRQAVAADIDSDNWSDVIGLAADGKPILLHNKRNGLRMEADALGSDWPADLVALTVCDFNGDYHPDVLVWSESQGLELRENQGNGNHALHLELMCMKQRDHGSPVRCSADGFGTRVLVHAGATTISQEWTPVAAGLGQWRQPLLLGLGRTPRADVVRLRWPDGTWQAERAFLAGRRNFIEWKQRKLFW